jgi:sirohydrochlorin ferrochelatase
MALLVDHGSPTPEVTAVRNWLAGQLELLAQGDYQVAEAAMERRQGPEYAFNGALLEEALQRLQQDGETRRLVVAMQFLGPGRHAGRGGDVETICEEARAQNPALEIGITRLLGEDDELIDILTDRARAKHAIAADPFEVSLQGAFG